MSLLLFVGSILLGLLYVVTVPRLLNLAIKPDKVYPLYGFHYWVHRAIGRMSNVNSSTICSVTVPTSCIIYEHRI
jgi:hypothetical protein